MAIEKAGVEITAIDSATRVFNQIAASAKNVEKTFDGVQAAGASIAAGFSLDKVIQETVQWEQASIRLNAVLRATSSAAGLTRSDLDDMAASLSESTPFNDRDIRNAEANLLKFGNIHDAVFREALKLSADFAAFTGSDMTSASQALGRALADPVNGLKALQREFGNLTFSQKEYIAQLEAAGKTEEAQAAILEIIRNKIGGTAGASNTGLTGFLGVLGKAWDQVGEAAALAFDKMQKSPSMIGGMMDQDPAMMGPPAPKPETWDDQMARQTAEQNAIIAKQAEATDRVREAHAKAVPVLKQWTGQLTETTKIEQANTFLLEGQGRTWNDLDAAKLRDIATTLDQRKALQAIASAQADSREQVQRATMAADAIQESYLKGARDRQESMQFEIELIGKTAYEQQQLNAIHEIELRQRAALSALANTDLDPTELARRSENIIAASQRETAAVLTGMSARRKAERDWSTGTLQAFNDYIDHATNAAEQANMLFTNAFKSMEDALVSFVMTGKSDFTALANSIIADIVRIQVRAGIASVGSASSGFFAGLFGSGGAGQPEQLSGPVAHGGGVIGQDAFPMRSMPASTWSGAPRYHLGVDEVPAILQRGETVLPRGAKGGNYYIDARNADSAGMARLESMIRQLNGSIEFRAVGAVQRAYNQRGVATPMG